MSALRVLHVDDEPDIREIVEISLGLDPELIVRSCSSGEDAIAQASDWSPDLVLLDVRMPGMDGPTTLAHLRDSRQTADIPVIFLTARAQQNELERFRALGADGVISKPFDPLTLAPSIRNYMREPASRFVGARVRFLKRARDDVTALKRDRPALVEQANGVAALDRISKIAHRLTGGGGTVGFSEISVKAFSLEQTANAAIAALSGIDTNKNVERALDELIVVIERACLLPPGSSGVGRPQDCSQLRLINCHPDKQ
jgi:CheY-like chemotaxis protein